MAITATTLSGAINATQTSFALASVTYVSNPNNQTGSGVTWLFIDGEIMPVKSYNSTSKVVNVTRGYAGTVAAAHAVTCEVLVGAPSDFAYFVPTTGAFSATQNSFVGLSAPVASAATITASGRRFHITGTTQSTTMNPPTGMTEGLVTVIADGVWTWTTGGTAGAAFAVAGTVTTAGSMVEFYLDAATGLWYPSRLA